MTEVQQLLIDNLKFYRVEKKLTQANVAKTCDMLPSTYSRLETGQVSPQLQTLERVCDAIGIPVVDLFRSREVKDQTIIEKLEAIAGLSEYNRNVVEILLDSIIEKDKLEKSQEVTMKKRLEELGKVREK
jgi:transcriptional regulator with XRE-family HTH domain